MSYATSGLGDEGNAADWPANWQGYPGDPSAAPPDVTPAGAPQSTSTSSGSDYNYMPIGPPDYGSSGGGGGGGGGTPSYPSSGDSGTTQAGLGTGGLVLGLAIVAAIGYVIVSK